MGQTDTYTLNRVAGAKAHELVEPLSKAARENPGGPEARQLVAIGCDVITHITEAIIGEDDPVVQEALEAARAWADGKGVTKKLEDMYIGSLIRLEYKYLPEDHQTRRLSAFESAKAEASNLLRSLVRASLYLEPEWLARALERGDDGNYAPEGAAKVLHIVTPGSANVLRDNGHSDKSWREHQNDVRAIIEARLAK